MPDSMSPVALTLEDTYAPIRAELQDVRRAFEQELVSDVAWVNELCAELAGYRGKMVRPALVLLTGQACGSLRPAHLTLAAVVEMVHLATLVHDDVLDETDVRRALPTARAAHGNEAAVLLGDYLISHAFHLCSSLDSATACRLIGATTNTVCEGELLQVHRRGHLALTEDEYMDVIRRKTASLIALCCELGARYANADAGTVAALTHFGMELGTAFQIVDDLLDVVGSSEELGKPAGNDVQLGKPTLATIHCLSVAEPSIRDPLCAVLSGRRQCTNGELRRWTSETGSIAYAETRARDCIQTAMNNLDTLAPTPAKASLQALGDFVLQRRY
ncbi:MAG: polyprenyl synthetase family protein [Planctomycetes bacterium]|nr:polyprenyl synthetase family protein [Planctomycetota bacterium]